MMETGHLEGVSFSADQCRSFFWAVLTQAVWIVCVCAEAVCGLQGPVSKWSQGGLGDSQLLLSEHLTVSCGVWMPQLGMSEGFFTWGLFMVRDGGPWGLGGKAWKCCHYVPLVHKMDM